MVAGTDQRDGGGIAGGGVEGEQGPCGEIGVVAAQGEQGGVVFVEADIERGERAGEAFTERLDDGFLAAPGAEEGGGAFVAGVVCELVLLGGREEACGDVVGGAARVDVFDVDADLGAAGDGEQGEVLAVGEVEAERGIGEGRFTVGTGGEGEVVRGPTISACRSTVCSPRSRTSTTAVLCARSRLAWFAPALVVAITI